MEKNPNDNCEMRPLSSRDAHVGDATLACRMGDRPVLQDSIGSHGACRLAHGQCQA